GVTDGLPVVPPTRERVERMLAETTRSREALVAEVPPSFGRATVEKLAINAVMAGCRPDYFPVVLAIVEAACDPVFNLHGQSGTTNAASPLIIVNGPIRQRLGVNCAAGVFGPGLHRRVRGGVAVGAAPRRAWIRADRQHGDPLLGRESLHGQRSSEPCGAAARRIVGLVGRGGVESQELSALWPHAVRDRPRARRDD